MSGRSPKTPLRMCAACRRRASQKELVRLAVRGESVVFDPTRRLPGRGAYICRRPECLEALLEKDCGERAFRRKLNPEAWGGLLSQQDLFIDACSHNKEDVRRI